MLVTRLEEPNEINTSSDLEQKLTVEASILHLQNSHRGGSQRAARGVRTDLRAVKPRLGPDFKAHAKIDPGELAKDETCSDVLLLECADCEAVSFPCVDLQTRM